MTMKRTLGILAAVASAVLLIGAPGASAAGKTVKVSGKAFIFNHMDTYISGATVKVREFPKISTTTDGLGDYVLNVPNDANVTPYILSGEGELTKHSFADDSPTGTVQTHWNEIDLQTFHTRGQDIENANFQTPADGEYAGLKALLNVPSDENGRPQECAIVTTASATDVRGVDYHGYWANTPHGVPGATSLEYPAIDGPVYFNESVIPDKTKTVTSEDGGIVWPIVPTGTYRIVTTSPDARFASFLATCKPGRVINANPPWGAYELSPGEKPLGASNVAGSVTSVRAYRKGKRARFVEIKVNSGEALTLGLVVQKGHSIEANGGTRQLKPGNTVIRLRLSNKTFTKAGKYQVKWDLKDASGVRFSGSRQVKVPGVIKKKRR